MSIRYSRSIGFIRVVESVHPAYPLSHFEYAFSIDDNSHKSQRNLNSIGIAASGSGSCIENSNRPIEAE